MKTVCVKHEVEETDIRRICENSIERVFNTALENLQWASERTKSEGRQALLQLSLEDLGELKKVTTQLWNNVRDQAFRDGLR